MSKGLKDWIEIFSAGKHTDASGTTREFTIKDLDTIVAKYNEGKQAAPVVIGHPKTNDPAFAWVDKLKREGNKLLAKLRDINPDFEKLVSSGAYRERSISLYPDLSLRHLGFLGAMPPAVKGLSPISFSNSDDYMTFTEEIPAAIDLKFNSLSKILRNLREWLISKFGIESADTVIPNYCIEDLNSESEFNEHKEVYNMSEKEEIEKLKKELEEKNKKLLEFAEAEKSRLDKEKKDRVISFAEKLISEGRLLPKDKENYISFAFSLIDDTISFSEKGNTNLLERFLDYSSKMPVIINFSEKDKYKKSDDDNSIDFSEENKDIIAKKVREYAESHNLSYNEALKILLK